MVAALVWWQAGAVGAAAGVAVTIVLHLVERRQQRRADEAHRRWMDEQAAGRAYGDRLDAETAEYRRRVAEHRRRIGW